MFNEFFYTISAQMGTLYSRINGPLEQAAGNVAEIITGRKRKRDSETSSEDLSNMLEKSLSTPKR